MRSYAAASFEGSGFTSRAELTEWLEHAAWLDDRDANPSAYALAKELAA